MDKQKLMAHVNERRHLIEQLTAFNNYMQDAVNDGDVERFEKMERDFNHLIGQLEYVGKRS